MRTNPALRPSMDDFWIHFLDYKVRSSAPAAKNTLETVMTNHIKTDTSHRVLSIRIDRPARKNALTAEMYGAMAQALAAGAADDSIRAIMLLGHVDCFTSGNDLTAFSSGLDGALGQFIQAIITCPKPLIAAPCGLAIGIGLTMLPYFDLVYAGEKTMFSAPFTKLGICPELGSSFTLTRLLGHQRASALLLAGETLSAETAREVGLVNKIAPSQEIEGIARERAQWLASLPPRAIRTTKALMRRWSLDTAQEANAIEMKLLVELGAGPESAEALAAFAQKRRPDFSRF